MPTHVYVAPEDYESELASELTESLKCQACQTGDSSRIEKRGRLFIVQTALTRDQLTTRPVAWAQNVWYDCKQIEFESISTAAKALRALGPRWHLHSTANHRRAQLIAEQLPKLRLPTLDLKILEQDEPLPTLKPLGNWTLLSEKRLLASTDCASPWPDGQPVMNEDKTAPSRAYQKLWELFLAEGVRPLAGDKCIELGAAPGGWTHVLAKLGCEVIAVDRAELAPSLAKQKRVSSMKRNAFTLRPEDVGPIQWLFSDLICYPHDLLELVRTWMESGLCENFVCTLKFKGQTDMKTARLFAEIPGSRLKHLSVNKHELTWWLVRTRDSRVPAGTLPERV